MSRWIRFILISLRAFFRSKEDPRTELRLNFWTWITDADVGLVNNASILFYTELGRLDFLVRSRLLFKLAKKGIYFPAASAHLTFVRPLKRFQKLELRTRLFYWDPKWIWVQQEVYFKKKGEDILACRAIIKTTLRKGRESIPFNEVLKEIDLSIAPMEKPALVEALEQAESLTG